MAGPAGATLQATKRGKRYWHLKNSVQAAVMVASGRTVQRDQNNDLSAEAPGLLEASFSPPLICNLNPRFEILHCIPYMQTTYRYAPETHRPYLLTSIIGKRFTLHQTQEV